MLEERRHKFNRSDQKYCTGPEPKYHRRPDGSVQYDAHVSSSGVLGEACLLDENVPSSFALLFSELGFRVERVTHTLQGANDSFVLRYAQERNQLVVSQDKSDLGRLIFSQEIDFSQGVVLIRKPDVNHVRKVIQCSEKPLLGHFTTVDHKSYPRQRCLP